MKKGKLKSFTVDPVNEGSTNLLNTLIERLETSLEVIEDFVEVFGKIDYKYDVKRSFFINLERISLY